MAIPNLTGRQRRFLRAEAHALSAVVRLGQQGLSPSAVEAIDHALAAHELIKVRLAAGREQRRGQVETLEQRLGCASAGVVGQVAILFRPNPDPERRRIELPS